MTGIGWSSRGLAGAALIAALGWASATMAEIMVPGATSDGTMSREVLEEVLRPIEVSARPHHPGLRELDP